MNNDNALVHVIRPDQARVNVTYGGHNNELPDPMHFDVSDVDVKRMLTEALRAGSIPGIAADANADITDFVVDRFPPTEGRDHNLIMVRPKTPFGMAPGGYRPYDPPTGPTQASPRVQCCHACGRPY